MHYELTVIQFGLYKFHFEVMERKRDTCGSAVGGGAVCCAHPKSIVLVRFPFHSSGVVLYGKRKHWRILRLAFACHSVGQTRIQMAPVIYGRRMCHTSPIKID